MTINQKANLMHCYMKVPLNKMIIAVLDETEWCHAVVTKESFCIMEQIIGEIWEEKC